MPGRILDFCRLLVAILRCFVLAAPEPIAGRPRLNGFRTTEICVGALAFDLLRPFFEFWRDA